MSVETGLWSYGVGNVQLLWALRWEVRLFFCPSQIVNMQIQRAADEMKIYVSPDPQEKKKALR